MIPTSNPELVVLAIETSCDDTAAAVLRGRKVLSQAVSSELQGSEFGGIVPELASRAHQRNVLPVVKKVLTAAPRPPGLIAATQGPGLVGSLLVGLNIAKGLALAWNTPWIGVHHIEAHILACLLVDPSPDFPFAALVVSGGHTLLAVARSVGDYEVVGETLDDAAGECFDKVARLLNVEPVPGSLMAGPVIDRLAQRGDPSKVVFPRPMRSSGDFHFSFSGLKTSVMNYLGKHPESLRPERLPDVCAGFQESIVDVLTEKSVAACERYGLDQLVVTGGVAANSRLRHRMAEAVRDGRIKVFFPPKALCTDNAVMIGWTGALHHSLGRRSEYTAPPRPSWPLGRAKFI